MSKSKEEYMNERNEVLKKILNILEITEINKMLSLKSLDENIEKQNQILELESDIRNFFVCSRWTYFSNKNRKFKRNYLSLIKAIMKVMKVKMNSSTLITKIDETTNKYGTYYIFDF